MTFILENLYYVKFLAIIFILWVAYEIFKRYLKRKPKDPDLKAIETAGHLLEDGKKAKATVLTEKILQSHPQNKKVYSLAVFNYWTAEMYKEAKAVFPLYKSIFGEDLKADVTFEDLEAEEKRYQELTEHTGDTWTFKARYLKFKIVINLGLPFVIREVQVSPKGFLIKRLYKDEFYEWKDIYEAFVTEPPNKDVIVKVLVMRTDNKKIELSDLYFEKGWVMLEKAIPMYLKISRHKYKEKTWLILLGLPVWIGLLIIFRLTDNWAYFVADMITIFAYYFYTNKLNKM